jgi:hypothetical protein
MDRAIFCFESLVCANHGRFDAQAGSSKKRG